MKVWITRILRSKTLHAANVIAILGIMQTNSDFLSTIMTPKQFGFVMMGISIVMVILRANTNKALSDK